MLAAAGAQRTAAATDLAMMTDEQLPSLHPSDADLQRVERVLRAQLAADRLTLEEFELRLGAVYGAQTLDDLGRVSADLGTVDDPISAQTDRVSSGAVRKRRGILAAVI